MSTGEITNVVIGVVIVAVLVARQMQTRPVLEGSVVRIVAILGVIGVVEIVDSTGGHSLGVATAAWIVGSLIIGGALGVVRALTVRIWRVEDGSALRRGTVATALLWIVALGAHLAMEIGIDRSTSIAGLGASTLLLYLAVTLGSQREVIRWRTARLASRPR